jgi:hypothetical protein
MAGFLKSLLVPGYLRSALAAGQADTMSGLQELGLNRVPASFAGTLRLEEEFCQSFVLARFNKLTGRTPISLISNLAPRRCFPLIHRTLYYSGLPRLGRDTSRAKNRRFLSMFIPGAHHICRQIDPLSCSAFAVKSAIGF